MMFRQMGFLSPLQRHNSFRHGIYPLEHKELTAGKPIKRLAFAPLLVIPLSQHRGQPAVPLVKAGQEVVRGEPIARAEGFMSVPMHAPATGVVTGIDLCHTAQGPKTEAIYLKVYQAATQRVLYEMERDPCSLSPEEIVAATQEAGLVGLGGAAFPTHAKMRPPLGRTIHTLVANGCECEPYLTCDHRIMLERTDYLLRGVRIAMRTVGAQQAIIGVEDNKLDAVAAIRARLPADVRIRVEAVETKYPQGAEKMLIRSLLGKEVPSGRLPAEIGVAVFNVGTLAQLGELLPQSRGLIERVVTVSGPGIHSPGNYLVPIGTPLRFLLEQAGVTPDSTTVILGGPMMGMSVASLDVPITKAVSGVVVLEREEDDDGPRQVYPCIKCSYCLDACPMQLNPSMLGQLASHREYARMEEDYHLNDCFECGCCSYVCPSNIPLTQYFRIAKAINREARVSP